MTRQEKLLIRAMEECDELSQRISKALLFGEDETQVGVDAHGKPYLDNRQRIIGELNDLLAVLDMAGYGVSWVIDAEQIRRKQAKVEDYMAYAERLGK